MASSDKIRITDLEFDFGTTGISQLKVNVHE